MIGFGRNVDVNRALRDAVRATIEDRSFLPGALAGSRPGDDGLGRYMLDVRVDSLDVRSPPTRVAPACPQTGGAAG